MSKRCYRMILSLVVVLALGLSPALAQETPKRGGILHWWDYADPARLDIHTESGLSVSQAISGIFSGLVQWNPEDPTKGGADLAESWDVSADSTVFTFHLRKGVKWHDGEPFSSADALHSLKRILDPATRPTSPIPPKCTPRSRRRRCLPRTATRAARRPRECQPTDLGACSTRSGAVVPAE